MKKVLVGAAFAVALMAMGTANAQEPKSAKTTKVEQCCKKSGDKKSCCKKSGDKKGCCKKGTAGSSSKKEVKTK